MKTRAIVLVATLSLAPAAAPVAQALAQAAITARPPQTLTREVSPDAIMAELTQQVRAADAIEPQLRARLSPQAMRTLLSIQQLLAKNPSSLEAVASWRTFVGGTNLGGIDPYALVQLVLRESYVEQLNELGDYANKVKAFNDKKKALRDELTRIQSHPCRGNNCAPFQTNARDLHTRFGSAFLTRESDMAAYRAEIEAQLQTVSDDAQLAQVDMQNALQKEQQTLQVMSNISKQLYDTEMAVIRKIGG